MRLENGLGLDGTLTRLNRARGMANRYVVRDDVECLPPRPELDDCNVLRRAFLEARERLLDGCAEVHFSCVFADCQLTLRVLCLHPTVLSRSECLVDTFFHHVDGGTEHGALLAAGTACTGPVFEFYCTEQESCWARRRPLRRRQLIQSFLNDLVDWMGPHGHTASGSASAFARCHSTA